MPLLQHASPNTAAIAILRQLAAQNILLVCAETDTPQPTREKPRRPARMPEDWNKPAWFWDDSIDEKRWGVIAGYAQALETWLDEEACEFRYAEVECDEPAATELEPEWITPTEDHIGQMVEVRDHDDDPWCASKSRLRGIDPGNPYPFTAGYVWRFARIRNPKYNVPES
jgi:hypothetical protein